jgi:hypothetical protein
MTWYFFYEFQDEKRIHSALLQALPKPAAAHVLQIMINRQKTSRAKPGRRDGLTP